MADKKGDSLYAVPLSCDILVSRRCILSPFSASDKMQDRSKIGSDQDRNKFVSTYTPFHFSPTLSLKMSFLEEPPEEEEFHVFMETGAYKSLVNMIIVDT